MTKYMDRRTKKFKSLEENVRKLLKQELDIDVIRIAEIEDTDITGDNDEPLLSIFVKFNKKLGCQFVECGRNVFVNKDLFNAVKDWSDAVLVQDKCSMLDICAGSKSLSSF